MLQIVIWMMCVYMVLKGQELQQIARSSQAADRDAQMKTAGGWATFAYIAAVIFFALSLVQGSSMPRGI